MPRRHPSPLPVVCTPPAPTVRRAPVRVEQSSSVVTNHRASCSSDSVLMSSPCLENTSAVLQKLSYQLFLTLGRCHSIVFWPPSASGQKSVEMCILLSSGWSAVCFWFKTVFPSVSALAATHLRLLFLVCILQGCCISRIFQVGFSPNLGSFCCFLRYLFCPIPLPWDFSHMCVRPPDAVSDPVVFFPALLSLILPVLILPWVISSITFKPYSY